MRGKALDNKAVSTMHIHHPNGKLNVDRLFVVPHTMTIFYCNSTSQRTPKKYTIINKLLLLPIIHSHPHPTSIKTYHFASHDEDKQQIINFLRYCGKSKNKVGGLK